MRKLWMAAAMLILAVSGVTLYFYRGMPEYVASQWGISGEVSGYLPRFWGLFLLPMVSLGLVLLFSAIPLIDPLKNNIAQFRRYYDMFCALMIGFLLYLQILILAWNVGYHFALTQAMMPALALVIFSAGVLIEHSKRNWFVGIRTPWTLSSDWVWEKTHRKGGTWFKIAAGIMLLDVIFEDAAVWFILVPLLGVSLATVIYSYVAYREEKG